MMNHNQAVIWAVICAPLWLGFFTTLAYTIWQDR
jgi:hypothetical protein